jgi:uncharacterized YccA/Bax inhibitor family protein
MQQSSNPVLSEKLVKKMAKSLEATDYMTVSGSLVKTGFLLAMVVATGAWSWNFIGTDPAQAGIWVMGASLTAFVIAMGIIFWRPNPILAVLYAAAQGIVLGAISFLFNDSYQGIVVQAIMLTLGVTLAMFALYATRLVSVTHKLRSVIMIATVGVLFFYLMTFIIGLFSSSFVELVYSGTTGIVIAAFIVIIAALNLLLDFDFIEKGSEQKLPKQFEWYAAFGLMVTLIWLYVSILRLLGASRS